MPRVLLAGLIVVAGWLWWHSARVGEFKPVETSGPVLSVASNPPPALRPVTGETAHVSNGVVTAIVPGGNLSPRGSPGMTGQRPVPPLPSSVPATNASLSHTSSVRSDTPVIATNLFIPVFLDQDLGLRPAPGGNRVLEAQIALARQGFSPGSIDGVFGSQTRAAVLAYYEKLGLRVPPEAQVLADLAETLASAAFTEWIVAPEDFARLRRIGATWLAKSQQDRLDYESILELVAERSRSHPDLIRRLNPGVDWQRAAAGLRVRVPAIEPPVVSEKAALVRIHLGRRVLQVWGARDNLLAHFPCSIARRVEKRPAGETLRVTVVIADPNYTFDPEVFPESTEGRELGRKLVLQPGPNNPVGTIWIGLDKSGYGIHGTPRPEEVGRTESHGCFRLANWNAELLARFAWVGLPVQVKP